MKSIWKLFELCLDANISLGIGSNVLYWIMILHTYIDLRVIQIVISLTLNLCCCSNDQYDVWFNCSSGFCTCLHHQMGLEAFYKLAWYGYLVISWILVKIDMAVVFLWLKMFGWIFA